MLVRWHCVIRLNYSILQLQPLSKYRCSVVVTMLVTSSCNMLQKMSQTGRKPIMTRLEHGIMKSTSNRKTSHSSCLPLQLLGLHMLLMLQWYQATISVIVALVYVPLHLMASRVLRLFGLLTRELNTTSH